MFGGLNSVFKDFQKEMHKMDKFESILTKDLFRPFQKSNFLNDFFKPHPLFAFRKPKKDCKL